VNGSPPLGADRPLVVLDLNVVVSGLLAERSGASTPPAGCLAAARAGSLALCLSPGILARLRRVLGYPKLAFSEQAVEAIAREIVEWVPRGGWVPDFPAPPASSRRRQLCCDPEDEAVLRVALAAGAAFLVTGDAHLLHHLTPEGTRLARKAGLVVLTAREFLVRLPR